MKNFEFTVEEYFKLRRYGVFFALGGTMKPENFPLLFKGYSVKLITKSGREHIFKGIGEEIFAGRDPNKEYKRVLGTEDDIEEYLQDLINDPVRIVGYKIEE